MKVRIMLKAGAPFEFQCESLHVEVTPDGQHISKLDWENASPGIRFIHLDNIAAILNWSTDGDPNTAEGWRMGLQS